MPLSPRMKMMVSSPGPSRDDRLSRISRNGSVIHVSTISRCVSVSTRPPYQTGTMPMAAVMTVRSVTAPATTIMDTCAPTMMRLSMSRPRWSVPKKCGAAGAARMLKKFGSS